MTSTAPKFQVGDRRQVTRLNSPHSDLADIASAGALIVPYEQRPVPSNLAGPELDRRWRW